MGNVMAKGARFSDLGQPDLVAPQILVSVADDSVVSFADSVGDDIDFIKLDSSAVFFLKADALRAVPAGGTATWISDGVPFDIPGNASMNINTGFVNGATTTLSHVLDAPGFDRSDPSKTPMETVTVAGNFVFKTGNDTFTLLGAAAAPATTVATFTYDIRDIWAAGDSTTRRAKITSTQDPQGEFVTVFEVVGPGAANITAVAAEAATTTDDGLMITAANVPLVDADGDGDLDNDDVTITFGGGATATAESIDPSTGKITFTTAQATGTAATLTYSHADSSPSSKVFRGDVLLTSDPAAQGTNNDGVWANDGDTLTVAYLASDGTTISIDTVEVDGKAPDITEVTPGNGDVTDDNNPAVSFLVTDARSGLGTNAAAVISLSINGYDIPEPPLTYVFDASGGFQGIFSQLVSWLEAVKDGGFAVPQGDAGGGSFSMKITATDIAGNMATLEGDELEITIDTLAPELTSSRTGAEKTNITLGFNEKLAEDSIAASDFTVDGVQPSEAVLDPDDDTNKTVVLTVANELAPAAKPEIKIAGDGVTDPAGNVLDKDAATAVQSSSDGIDPSITTITLSKLLVVDDDEVKVTVDTDEKLTSDGAIISIFGAAGAAGEGAQSVTSPIPQRNEATLTVAGGTGTGQYGVAVQITDIQGNTNDNLTDVTEELATITTNPGDAQVANTPIADANFDGVLDGGDVTITIDGAATGTIGIDASAGTIDVGGAIAAGAEVLVTYSYVTDVFEVDQGFPAVTFDPAPAAGDTVVEIQDQSPFIRVLFTAEGAEYPGDTHSAATLTKAELTMPDDSTLDLLPVLVTTDNVEFLWPASDLDLGSYKLDVEATDDALNEGTGSLEFKIVERQPVDIALRPGWNLVSLPGAPDAAKQSIDDVITNNNVDVVLTYDSRSASGFQAAVRGPGGTFGTGQALKTIDGSKAFWVHTTTFDPLSVDIPGIQPGSAVLPPSFTLAAGWNLVPVGTLDLTTTARNSDDYFSGLAWSRAYGYANATNSFDSILPGDGDDAAPVGNLTVGQGYWIFLQDGGELVP